MSIKEVTKWKSIQNNFEIDFCVSDKLFTTQSSVEYEKQFQSCSCFAIFYKAAWNKLQDMKNRKYMPYVIVYCTLCYN